MPNPPLTDVSSSATLTVAALLEALVTNAVNNAVHAAIDTTPPPQVPVRYQDRVIMFSRGMLATLGAMEIFHVFTTLFNLTSNPDNGPIQRKLSKRSGNDYIDFVQMRLYVTFLRGPGVAEKEGEYEVSIWPEMSWRDLVPNIDGIRILTIPEFIAKLERDREELQRPKATHESEQGDPTPAEETEGTS